MSFHPLMPYGEGWHRSERQLVDEGPAFTFTADRAAQLEEICGKYPPERRKSAVLAALYYTTSAARVFLLWAAFILTRRSARRSATSSTSRWTMAASRSAARSPRWCSRS